MPRVGENIPLNLQLWDRAENKFVLATVRRPDGSELASSPVHLSHVSGGFYASQALKMPAGVEFVIAFYQVFDDENLTRLSSVHAEAVETFVATKPVVAEGGTAITAIVEAVSPELTAAVERIVQLGG